MQARRMGRWTAVGGRRGRMSREVAAQHGPYHVRRTARGEAAVELGSPAQRSDDLGRRVGGRGWERRLKRGGTPLLRADSCC